MKGALVDLILDGINVKTVRFPFFNSNKGSVDLVRKEHRWEVQVGGKAVHAPKTLEIFIERCL